MTDGRPRDFADGSRVHSATETSRRRLLQTLGSGAVLGLAGGSVPAAAQDGDGAAADAPWDVSVTGVEQWDFVVRDADEALDEPEVTVETEDVAGGAARVVVTGTHEFSRSGCDALYPRRIGYSSRLDRFGVVLDEATPSDDPTLDADDADCGSEPQLVAYELSAVVESVPGRAIVDERFAEGDRTVRYLEEEPGPALAQAVADYEFDVQQSTEFDGSVEAEPTVEFDGDQLVVTGAVRGANSCYSAAVARLDYADLANHVFRVDVESAYREDYMPGDGCFAAEVRLEYELVVTFQDELPPRVTVDENGERSVDVPNPDGGPRIRGTVEAYEYDAAYARSDDLDPEPPVQFDGDTVTIRGSREYPTTGCRAPVPEYLAFDEEAGRLGVVVSDADVSDACAEAFSEVVYEVTAELPAAADVCVVETRFEETERTVHYADGEPSIDLPPGVADYELTVGDSPDPGPAEPQVTFEGDRIVVESEATIGSSSCGSLALDALEWETDDRERLLLDVVQSTREDLLPLQDCTDDVATAPYELVITVDELPAAVSVSEQGTHQVTVEREDDDDELPQGVASVDLLVGDEIDRAIEPPGPHTGFSEESSTYYARGSWFDLDTSCETIELDRIEWATEDRRHLGVTIANALRDDISEDECTGESGSTEYLLEVTFADELPRTVHFTADDASDDVIEDLVDRGRQPVDLPDGVADYEFRERFDDGPFVPEPRVHFRDGHVSVEASLTLGGSSCTELGLLDVDYEDEAKEHLSVRIGGVYQRGESPFGGCTTDLYSQKYRIEFDVETLPEAVTVDERGAEMAETVTVERETDCADAATVDGQTVCDVDGDGQYMDVTGDGSVTNSDVTTFFRNQHAPAWNERADLFDFDGDGEVGQSDVVDLFESIA